MENAIDFNDELAELFAKKESNPELYAVGIDKAVSKAKVVSTVQRDPPSRSNSNTNLSR